MKIPSHLSMTTLILICAGIYACESDIRWLTPEDSIERCKDGIDNDDNGKIDCKEDSCKVFDHCKTPLNPVPEDTEALCDDGVDNNGNKKTDCQEESCKKFDHCQPPKDPEPEDNEDLCQDGIDNDNNQKTDCDEVSCKKYDYCTDQIEPEPENSEASCTDGVDNDKNGRKDCMDNSCKEFDSCKDENGNHMKDEFEPGFESAERCNKHSMCSSKFCDSYIGKCSTKCTSDDQCISGFVCRQDGRCSAEAFETVWVFEDPYTRINFTDPEDTVGECDFVIDWGDGTAKEKWPSCPTLEKQLIHVYEKPGEYHIKVTGKMTHWKPVNFHDIPTVQYLTAVLSYGPVGIAAKAFAEETIVVVGGNMPGHVDIFTSLTTLSDEIDIPDPTYLGMDENGERTLKQMFINSLLKKGVGKWDISNIVSLEETFKGAKSYNEDLDRWITSNVTNMSHTFWELWTGDFNGDVSTWDTSKVTTTAHMFEHLTQFTKGNLENWDVSNVTDMTNMFFFSGLKCEQFRSLAEAWNRPEVLPTEDRYGTKCTE